MSGRRLRGRYGPRALYDLVLEAGTSAGVAGRHFPHRWRHSYATDLRRGEDIHVVQRLSCDAVHGWADDISAASGAAAAFAAVSAFRAERAAARAALAALVTADEVELVHPASVSVMATITTTPNSRVKVSKRTWRHMSACRQVPSVARTETALMAQS
ncbi:MAG: hypothetical protein ABSD85_15035 [Acidimicrobiales bacterium]